MPRTARRCSIAVVLALLVTLCLSAAAGTASAGTVNTVQSAFMGVLYQQEYPDVPWNSLASVTGP